MTYGTWYCFPVFFLCLLNLRFEPHLKSACRADDLHDIMVDLRLCDAPAVSTVTNRDRHTPTDSRKIATAVFNRILHCAVPGHVVSSSPSTFGYTTFVRWAAPLDARLYVLHMCFVPTAAVEFVCSEHV